MRKVTQKDAKRQRESGRGRSGQRSLRRIGFKVGSSVSSLNCLHGSKWLYGSSAVVLLFSMMHGTTVPSHLQSMQLRSSHRIRRGHQTLVGRGRFSLRNRTSTPRTCSDKTCGSLKLVEACGQTGRKVPQSKAKQLSR